MPIKENKYIFHWLSADKLDQFMETGVIKPYWRHFLIQRRGFVKGISCAREPILWCPDEELPKEPCLIIDLEKVSCPVHSISSGDVYHFTKEVLRAKRKKQDIEALIDEEINGRKFVFGTDDELFLEGQLSIDWIAGVGFQSDLDTDDVRAEESARTFSNARSIPVLDMTDWVVGDPGVVETDEIIEEAVSEMSLGKAKHQSIKPR
jgi:hypothetical protein